MKSIVRVASNNNFNCTDVEYAQLDKFATDNPDKVFFVNSNVRTPDLKNITAHPYKAVITVNPDLKVSAPLVKRAESVASKVAFYRVKWLPEEPTIVHLVETMLAKAPVVITMQRFNSNATMERFHVNKDHYAHDCSRFRLHGEALQSLEAYVDTLAAYGKKLHICDRKGLGCLGCGLCATLNGAPEGTKIESLNLSSSGVCPYSCPDCYAKAMQKFLVGTGKAPMAYDKIKPNKKQSGQTEHIKHARQKAAA